MIVFHDLGLQEYNLIYQKMKNFIVLRKEIKHPDEVWFLEHFPVITAGSSSQDEDILLDQAHPIIYTDRGGQVTYHGPGQLIGYFLIDLRSRGLKVHQFIDKLQRILCNTLRIFNIQAETSAENPGIYVDGKKIASFGLKVSNGFTYHGFSLNVHMDLTPFSAIHPCGMKNISMANMIDYTDEISMIEIKKQCRQFIDQEFLA